MKELNIEELKEIQIEVLKCVADFCEENNIKYWIDCGTLLGAVRHKGYIPWDDDIDVGMLRDDYDKFSSLFNTKNERYKFICYENSHDFYLPHGKVCDTSTILYEPNEKGYKLAANIDIFVYDNAPDDDEQVKCMFDRRDKLRRIYNVKKERIVFNGNLIKGLLKVVRKTVYKLYFFKSNADELISLMIQNSKKYANDNTARVGNFTSFSRTVCNKRVFEDFIDLPFEGRMYKAPIGYDEWLRSFYGDYMELPPENKRVSHHLFKAYRKDIEDEK